MHLVAAWCLDYPDDELLDRLPADARGPGGAARRRRRRAVARLVDHLVDHAARTTCSGTTSTSSTSSRKHALYLSYWTDGDTRRRGEVLGRFKTALPRAAASLVDTHGELPDYLPMVLEFAALRRPGRRARAAAGLPRQPRAAADRAAGEGRARTPACSSPCARRCPGRRRADRAAVMAMAAAGPPDRGRRARALRPAAAAAAAAPVSTLMDVAAVGRPALRLLVVLVGGTIWRYRYDKFGWTTRSSQLYESRLLRIGSPLFHFGILLVLVGHIGGLVIPESWTEAVGVSEGLYHFNALLFGGIAGVCTLVGILILDLPPAHHRAGVHGHHQERQARCTSCSSPRSCSGCGRRSSASAPGDEAHNYRETVSPWFRSVFVLQPDVAADGGGPAPVPHPRPGRDAAVRPLAVHPAGARLHRAAALPVPALHRLPQPRRPAPRPGSRATAARLGAGRHPRPRPATARTRQRTTQLWPPPTPRRARRRGQTKNLALATAGLRDHASGPGT